MGKKAISEETRWQIIGMSKMNVSNVFIGKQLGVSEKCVRTTLRNFKLNNTVQDSPRCGRHTELTPKDKSKIFRMQRKNPTLSFRKIAKEFNSSGLNVHVSHETVRKVLRNKDFTCLGHNRSQIDEHQSYIDGSFETSASTALG